MDSFTYRKSRHSVSAKYRTQSSSETSSLSLSKKSTRKEGIISLSKLLIRSGPHAKGSSQTRAVEMRMADEAKDLGVISNNGTNPKAASTPQAEDPASPDASQGGPEVRILEEHVTHVAPPKSASGATYAPASPILEKPQVKPVAPTPPPIPPAATSAPVSSDVKVSPTKPVAPTP